MKLRHLLLPLLALALVALLLWLDREPAEHAYDTADAPRAEAPAPDLLTGESAPPPTAGPALAPTAPTSVEIPRGDVQVTVLGTAGVPLPGAFVALRATGEGSVVPVVKQAGGLEFSRGVPTDARGEVVLKDVPWDGSMTAYVYRSDPQRAPNSLVYDALPPQGHGKAERVVRGPRIVYRARTGLPMQVRVVSAETGSDLRDVKIQCLKARVPAPDRQAWQSAPHSYLMTPVVGRKWVIGFAVAPTDGWVAWDRAWRTVAVSAYTRALEFVYPMRREVPVTVLATEPDGGTVEAILQRLRVAGRVPPSYRSDGDAYGRLHIHGVPHLRDEQLEIGVSRTDSTGPMRLRAVIPEHPGARIELATVLPKEGLWPGEANSGTIGIGGGSSSFRSRGRGRIPNEVVVTVRRRDGTPAVDAEVTCGYYKGRTDAKGVLRLTNIHPGTLDVTVRQPGLLPLGGPVVVPSAGTARIDLREGPGADLEVLVVDGRGMPLPFASLGLKLPSQLPWVDLDGETQRIDPYTDHLGRRLLRGLEAGTVAVTARWGSRRVTSKADLRPGLVRTLTIVLPRPKPPR